MSPRAPDVPGVSGAACARRRACYDAPRGELLPRSRGLALDGRARGDVLSHARPHHRQPRRRSGTRTSNQDTLRLRDRLCARFGAARGELMANTSRFLLIFPNFSVQDTALRLPAAAHLSRSAPDQLDVIQWELVPREELPTVAALPRRRRAGVPGAGRLRHARRHGGAGVLPAWLPGARASSGRTSRAACTARRATTTS